MPTGRLSAWGISASRRVRSFAPPVALLLIDRLLSSSQPDVFFSFVCDHTNQMPQRKLVQQTLSRSRYVNRHINRRNTNDTRQSSRTEVDERRRHELQSLSLFVRIATGVAREQVERATRVRCCWRMSDSTSMSTTMALCDDAPVWGPLDEAGDVHTCCLVLRSTSSSRRDSSSSLPLTTS